MNNRGRMIKFDEELDVLGLNCPLPLLRTKKMLSQMKPGNVLKVLTNGPSSGNRLHGVFGGDGKQNAIA